MPDFSLKHWLTIYACLGGLLFLVTLPILHLERPLSLSVLDVGQGDAILIQTPSGRNVLVDSGPDSTVVDELGKQMGFFGKRIDLFILTHPHRDHDGGILDVLGKYDVGQVVMTGVPSGDPVYKTFVSEIKQRGIPIRFADSGADVRIDTNIYLDFLFPLAGQSYLGREVANANNTSVVARLVRMTEDGPEALALLTGDAEQEEELEILLSGQDVAGDVLKVGHHGSRTATSPAFFQAVNPTVAVISVGEGNTYEHPHAETMEKLQGLEVKQTMNEGIIVINF